MKMKKKGKVHPSPPQPPSNGDDHFFVLKLLPTLILALVSALSAKDREVLAYLITRSLNTTTSTNISSKKKGNHKVPVFDCESFDCYTNYLSIWDSSPNHEVIHQIIEAFEDHLTTNENTSSQTSNDRRKKKKTSQNITKLVEPMVVPDEVMLEKPPVMARKMLPDVLGLFFRIFGTSVRKAITKAPFVCF